MAHERHSWRVWACCLWLAAVLSPVLGASSPTETVAEIHAAGDTPEEHRGQPPIELASEDSEEEDGQDSDDFFVGVLLADADLDERASSETGPVAEPEVLAPLRVARPASARAPPLG